MKVRSGNVVSILVGLVIATGAVSHAQLADKKALTLKTAKQIAAVCEQQAINDQVHMFIVVADDGGNLMYVERMDDTQLGSLEVAIAKARSAVLFKRPTKVFEDGVHGGNNAILKVPNAMPIEGGIPLTVDSKILGAVGVSGGTPQQDGKVAQACVDAFPGIVQGK
jgi:glc operon protein GlcG